MSSPEFSFDADDDTDAQYLPVPKEILVRVAVSDHFAVAANPMHLSGPTGVHPLALLLVNPLAVTTLQRVLGRAAREHPDDPDTRHVRHTLATLDKIVAMHAAKLIGGGHGG